MKTSSSLKVNYRQWEQVFQPRMEGGLHSHAGMICDDADFITFLHNEEHFSIPANPGPYPATVDPDNVVMQAHQEAEDKVQVIEFDTYLGVAQSLHLKIGNKVDPEWLETMKSSTLSFTHKTPKEMINLLLC